MNGKLSAKVRLALIIVFCCTAALSSNACKLNSSGTLESAVVNGQTLNAGMSDTELIRAFGLDIKTAEVKRVQGKDGTSVTYGSGNQEVAVTRSTVSGVTVFAAGPVSGLWPLGKP